MAGLRLIVGLGNPGAEHARTRHNAGFWFIDALAESQRARFGLELCLVRPSQPAQVQSLLKLLAAESQHYQQHVPEAKELAGSLPIPAGVTAPELAGWTVVSNVLLNLDGVLSKN